MTEFSHKIDPSVLRQVARDNIVDQQIGVTDGISHEVARDLGYGDAVDYLDGVHGQVDPSATTPELPLVPTNSHLVELPGKDGRNNWYNQPSISPLEAQRNMPGSTIDRQQAINHAGAVAGRAVLQSIPAPKQ